MFSSDLTFFGRIVVKNHPHHVIDCLDSYNERNEPYDEQFSYKISNPFSAFLENSTIFNRSKQAIRREGNYINSINLHQSDKARS